MYHRQAQNLPSGTMIFLGDSHIQGLSATAVHSDAVNFGIGHQQLQDLVRYIRDYPEILKNKTIVIGIGINDLLKSSQFNSENAIENLLSALKRCDCHIFLLSILPVNEEKLSKPGLNGRIATMNRQFNIAVINAGIVFINFNKLFADQTGQLATKYDLGDGIHLNSKGYELLIKQIKLGLLQGSINER